MIVLNFSPEEMVSMIESAVQKALASNVPQGAQHEIISRAECMKRLGVSEPTIIKYGERGTIPEMRIGKHVRYEWQSVCAALAKNRRFKNK